MQVRDHIRTIPDFPKEGIMFRDVLSTPFMILSAIALFGQAYPTILRAEAAPDVAESRSDEPKKSDRESERWEALSEEEREKLKKALREVWADPAVLSAREEVKLASEAYQEAIRSAVGKADPTVVELLKEIQDINEGKTKDRLKGSGPGRFSPNRGIEFPAGPPAFLEKLTPEEREQFRAAEEKAQSDEGVQAAKKHLEQIRSQDDQLRKRRMEAHLKMRRAVLDAMFKENPELQTLQSRLGFTPSGSGKVRGEGKKGAPFGKGGKGKE